MAINYINFKSVQP